MITPNYLEKLLDGVEVEWKSLGELFDISAGGDVPKDALSDIKTDEFNIPILSNGIYDKALYGWTNKAKIDNPSITISARGTIGWASFRNEPFFPIVRLLVLTPKIELNLKYAYHFMKMIENDYEVPKSGIPQLTKPMIKDINIPIPCPKNPAKSLEIQAEIVRILDTFTELTAELTARKKQYEYYRDKLLTFEEGEVEWKALLEVTLPTSNIRWRDTSDTYQYIDLTSVCRDKNIIIETTEISAGNAPSRAQKLVIKDDVIFATTRPTQQRLCLITEEFSGEVASTGYCILRAKEDEALPKWIYYFITSSRFRNYVEENQSGSAYPAISDAKVKEFKIPLPSLKEQERIVFILDKFEKLTTSITEGLPREIELRQKQYEYYRNMLLNFPKEV